MIEPGRGRGTGVKGLVIRPDVSRKEQARRPGFQFYRGGTEYVSRVAKPEPEIGRQCAPAFHTDAPGRGRGTRKVGASVTGVTGMVAYGRRCLLKKKKRER